MSVNPFDPSALPCLTADLPGIGGVVKQRNEDFVVEEVPLYEPSGEGTHTYFGVEKIGLTTSQVAGMVAAQLGVPARNIGYAGMKDAHAVTRQVLSVEHVAPQRVAELGGRQWRVLWTALHGNKLRTGHLKGNRFIIRIRDAAANSIERARVILDVLSRRGVPNYFDSQRFGARGDNAAIGLAAIRGDYEAAFSMMLGQPREPDHGPVREARARYDAGDLHAAAAIWPKALIEQRRACQALLRFKRDARRAWGALDRRLSNLYLSALQSELFNRVLTERLGAIDHLYVGDLAWKHANGAVFRVVDEAVEQPRCVSFEISPSGPLFGSRMTEAEGLPGQIEERVLAGSGLSKDDFRAHREARTDGARRPLRFQPKDVELDAGADDDGPFVGVALTLDAGCYATIVLREICKTPAIGPRSV